MLYKLFVLFIVVPLAELTLLLLLANATHWMVSIWLVILSGLLGAWLARRQGFSTMQRIRVEMSQGKMPTDSLIDAGMILFAGGLLLTPGILTDAFGISLLIPVCRRWYKLRLIAWFKKNFSIQTMTLDGDFQPHATGRSEVIDSRVLEPGERATEPDTLRSEMTDEKSK